MNYVYNTIQRQALSLLLDKYEKSATYKGENKVSQTFSISPKDILRNYGKNDGDYAADMELKDSMQQLLQQNLIRLDIKNHMLNKIIANTEAIDRYYEILNRVSKNDILKENIQYYQSKALQHSMPVRKHCEAECIRIQQGKAPFYEREDFETIAMLCDILYENKEPLYERTLSIKYFYDTKLFEKKYRSKLCGFLKKYADLSEEILQISDDTEQMHAILEEFFIFANPKNVLFKGHCKIHFKDGGTFIATPKMPLSISSEQLPAIEKIVISSDNIMTIENLTSYQNMPDKNCLYIYLAGYHNTVKQKFLTMLYRDNPGKHWYHFGDIDPDGYYILSVLKRKTGIPFEPFHMDASKITDFMKYTKPLEEADRKKIEHMVSRGIFDKEMTELLATGRKLEQEIISYLLTQIK